MAALDRLHCICARECVLACVCVCVGGGEV